MKQPISMIVLASLLSFSIGSWQSAVADAVPQPQLPLQALQDFVNVYERVRSEHIEPHSDEELLTLALQGLMLKLDPYSAFLDADATRALEEATSGSYVGIGLEIEPAGHHILVITPIDGSPAQIAGIQAGDWVTHINNRSVKGLDQMAIYRLISGPEGSEVKLRIMRQGQQLELTMQRTQINIPSVRSEMMANQIGYLRISQFQEQTAAELIKHMQTLHKEGAKAWLLDLRNNPGGLVDSGVAVADAFLRKGTIVSIRARHEDGNLDYSADAQDHSKKLPTLVLINQGSASAAEIVAAALQENRRAKLAGQTSFGKGSVQSVISLDEERSIKLTTAYYYTPRGYNLNSNGIKPDYKFSSTITSEAALEKALDLLHKQLWA